MHAALDGDMTFFDNAWDYHDGKSEEWMGEALAAPGKRKQCFLMTKNCGREPGRCSTPRRQPQRLRPTR